jgi:hypothetical protein
MKSTFTPLNLFVLTILSASITSGQQYLIESESIDSGGGQANSASYSNTSSMGGIGGIGTAGPPDLVARAGYPGRLYEIESFNVSANPATVDEGDPSQLSAILNLDDGTIIEPANIAVQWSKDDGPNSPVNGPFTDGSVTAKTVYMDSSSNLQGSYRGESDTTILTILNSDSDNYAEYGSDGIDDDWQIAYFDEPPNPDAHSSANPDGDANDNTMEFLTGFDPTDPNSWFKLTITDKTGSVTTLKLNKVIENRTYTIEAGTDLQSFPETITILNPSAEELNKVITDDSATEQKKFYRVDITKP